MRDEGAPALQLNDVTKKYGQVAALRELSMAVEAGEMFGLIGPDGAGKTTAIRLMCGLLKPDGGRVRVLGRDPVGEHLQVTQTIGYLSRCRSKRRWRRARAMAEPRQPR